MASIETLAESPARVQDRDRVEQFVLVFLAAANVFDMGGSFGLKYASFGLCALLLVFRFREVHMPLPVFVLCLGLFLVWPLIASIRGVMHGAEIGNALQKTTAFLPALLVMPVIASSRQPRFLVDVVMRSLLALAVVEIGFFLLLLAVGDLPQAKALVSALSEMGQGYFGVRGLGSIIIPNVYFKATLLLVAPCAWFLFRRRYLAAGLCLAAMAFAFSRSGVLLAGMIVVAYALMFGNTRVRIGLLFLLAVAVFLLWRNAELLQINAVLDMYGEVLTVQGGSTGVRAGHLQSIIELLANDPEALWLGQGAGVPFFSTGRNTFVDAVELDHLEAIRTFGLVWFVCFSILVFRAAGVGFRLLSDEARGLRIAVIAAYLAAGTNPVLINPLFCILVAAAYGYHFVRAPAETT